MSGAKQQALAAQQSPVNRAQVEKRTLSAIVSQAGILTYRARSDGSPYSVINQARGTYTNLPLVGVVTSQGHVLYRVNGTPVVLLRGSTPAYRTLSPGMTGADVAELNADLVALGYATSAQLNPRSASFGSATTTALEKLQAAVGVTQTGTLTLGQAVFEPTAVRVTAVSAPLGSGAQPGQTVLQATSTTRQVQVALDASQQTDVAVGDKVTITLPNNHTSPGVVSSVGTVATCPSSSGSGGSSSSSAAPGTDTCSSGSSGSTTPTIAVDVTPSYPGRHGQMGSGAGAGRHHHCEGAQRAGGASDRAAGPLRRWLRGRSHRRRHHKPSRAGLARAVRRCRRAGTGHRLRTGRRPTSGGASHMTYTPPSTPDNKAVAAGNGFTIGGAGGPVIDVENVTKSYPGEPPVRALHEVNLTIGPGELVGIAGPSGSGKTTLLQLIGTLDRPTSGRVRITGLDVAAMADEDVAHLRATRIGFVFQQFFLAEHSSALDNVADGLLYAGIPLKQRREGALDALGLVGLAERPHALPTQLSGGQRQRVAIARALVGQPAIVLADEPTGNLDQATGKAILALIDQLHQAGSTIVVITHDPAIAERMPRKVEILDGRIVADTGPAAGADSRIRPLAKPPAHARPAASGPPASEDPS